MKTESREDFQPIKAELLATSFAPIARCGFSVNDYEPGSVCAKLPSRLDAGALLQVIDRYTSGNSGAIISPGPHCGADGVEQWLIMPPKVAAELKSNLRINAPRKPTNRDEANDISRSRSR
jgi:hypothetical protein